MKIKREKGRVREIIRKIINREIIRKVIHMSHDSPWKSEVKEKDKIE